MSCLKPHRIDSRSCHEFGSRVDAKMHFIKCLRGDRVVLGVMEAAVDALPDSGDRLAKGGLGSAIMVGLHAILLPTFFLPHS